MGSKLNRRDFLKLSALLPLVATRWSGSPPRSTPNPDKPNLLILLFDTLSAPHMSTYGYHRDTTPNLSKFADRSTIYHRHYSAGNFTSPGTASILTGMYPWSHRCFNFGATVRDEYANRNIFNLFPSSSYYKFAYTHNPKAMSLLFQMQEEINDLVNIRELSLTSRTFTEKFFPKDYNISYRSEILIGGKDYDKPSLLFHYLAEPFRMSKTLRDISDQIPEDFPRGTPHNNYGNFYLLEDVMDWLEDRMVNGTSPFLGYIHVQPPHEPYYTRREFVDRFLDDWSEAPADNPLVLRARSGLEALEL